MRARGRKRKGWAEREREREGEREGEMEEERGEQFAQNDGE